MPLPQPESSVVFAGRHLARRVSAPVVVVPVASSGVEILGHRFCYAGVNGVVEVDRIVVVVVVVVAAVVVVVWVAVSGDEAAAVAVDTVAGGEGADAGVAGAVAAAVAVGILRVDLAGAEMWACSARRRALTVAALVDNQR